MTRQALPSGAVPAPASRPRAVAVLALAVCAGMVGCRDGYSTVGVSTTPLETTLPADEILDELIRSNKASLTASRWRFTLVVPCELSLKAQRPDGSAEVVQLELRQSDVQVKGNVGGSSHGVLLAYAGAPELADERVFEAPRWTDAVEYATQFQALQRSCATDEAAAAG